MAVTLPPFPIEEPFVGLFAGSRGVSHALVNVREALDHQSSAIVARQRFLAGDANRFGHCQSSGARQSQHRIDGRLVLDA